MAVYSMTGYASVQSGNAPASADPDGRSRQGPFLGLEIRSVNSRFLDLSFRLPDELRQHEPALRELLTKQLRRGKVEVRMVLTTPAGGALPEPNPRLLQRLASVQDSVRAWLPTAAVLSVAEALRLTSLDLAVSEDLDHAVLPLAAQATAALSAAREREGARLAAMILDRLAQLRRLADLAGPMVPRLVEQQRSRFLERWREAMALAEDTATLPEAAQDRALTEATAFAIRIDVAEELTRLDSHLQEIERLVRAGGEIGKRLDFLIQELHREANTLGSKSAAMELTRVSVDMKVLIEQMREQVQNIE